MITSTIALNSSLTPLTNFHSNGIVAYLSVLKSNPAMKSFPGSPTFHFPLNSIFKDLAVIHPLCHPSVSIDVHVSIPFEKETAKDSKSVIVTLFAVPDVPTSNLNWLLNTGNTPVYALTIFSFHSRFLLP